jgi:hypothetical protein
LAIYSLGLDRGAQRGCGGGRPGLAMGRFLLFGCFAATHFCPLPASEADNVAPLRISTPRPPMEKADL